MLAGQQDSKFPHILTDFTYPIFEYDAEDKAKWGTTPWVNVLSTSLFMSFNTYENKMVIGQV
jgi:hypothetical protein